MSNNKKNNEVSEETTTGAETTETTTAETASDQVNAAESTPEHLPATTDQDLSFELEGLADYENSIAGMLAQAEKLETKEKKISLTSKYLELSEIGKKFRGVFAGFTTILAADKATGDAKELKAARFIGTDKTLYVNAGVALVNELLKSAVPVGVSLEVTFAEKKGQAKIYTIDLLG